MKKEELIELRNRLAEKNTCINNMDYKEYYGISVTSPTSVGDNLFSLPLMVADEGYINTNTKLYVERMLACIEKFFLENTITDYKKVDFEIELELVFDKSDNVNSREDIETIDFIYDRVCVHPRLSIEYGDFRVNRSLETVFDSLTSSSSLVSYIHFFHELANYGYDFSVLPFDKLVKKFKEGVINGKEYMADIGYVHCPIEFEKDKTL